MAGLKGRISLLEGSAASTIRGHNGNSIDDFSIKVSFPLSSLILRYSSTRFVIERCLSARQAHQPVGL